MPTVSIIVPAYNGDRFITDAVQSVLMQTDADWELVIVDDGSSDTTGAIARFFVHQHPQRIRYVTQSRQGVAAARNRGLAETSGEFVAFLDQDDTFLPQKLACQVERLLADPSLDLVHSGWRTIDAQGNLISTVEPWNRSLTVDLGQWLEWKPVFLGAMLFRRSLLEAVGGFRSQWQQTDDVDLVLRAVRHGCTAVWVPQLTVNYRQHEGNTSRKVHQQVAELEQVVTAFFQETEGDSDFAQWRERSLFQSLVWSAWQLHRYGYTDDALHSLKKSLQFTPFLKSETILHWIERFSAYSREYGVPFDVEALVRSPVWRDLVTATLFR